MKTGRNVPCPCGSGKKYKHCCLAGDEVVTRNNANIAEQNRFDYDSELFENMIEDDMMIEHWESRAKHTPARLHKQHANLSKSIRNKAELDTLLMKIKNASHELEKYQNKFARLQNKPAKFLQRAEKLFSEEPFNYMRFDVSDIQMVFEKIGYPSNDDLLFKNAHKYIEYLVDAELQETYSCNLMMQHLPDYVAAKRHIDACIIQHSIMIMDEAPKDVVSPFLMCIFMQGLCEWENKRDSEQLEIFSKLGLDPDEIRRRGIDGASSLIQEVMAKNGTNVDLNEILNVHPELRAFTEAQCYESEKVAIELMQHKKASRFLLSFDEIEPWLETFAEGFRENSLNSDTVYGNNTSRADNEQVVADMVFSTCADMAGEIFTKPRREQLVNDIYSYRKKLRKKDRKTKQAGINFLIMEATNCESPSDNHILVMLCFNSVKLIINNICESDEGNFMLP